MRLSVFLNVIILCIISYIGWLMYSAIQPQVSFEFYEPVKVVDAQVEIGDYLELEVVRCRYLNNAVTITRKLIYPNNRDVNITSPENPDTKVFEPNCIDKNGNLLSVNEAQPQPLPTKIFIPKSIDNGSYVQDIEPGCGVKLQSIVEVISNVLRKPEIYEVLTEDFCLYQSGDTELLENVDVLIN